MGRRGPSKLASIGTYTAVAYASLTTRFILVLPPLPPRFCGCPSGFTLVSSTAEDKLRKFQISIKLLNLALLVQIISPG
jgi:hypothetical protein